MLTQSRLKELLVYDPATGVFRWRVARRGCAAGAIAGSNCKGYCRIRVVDREYYAHRLAWLYMTGCWPSNEIDHINCVQGDNRWMNLREATRSQNRANSRVWNNKLGIKGVRLTRSGKFEANITVNSKRKYLGTTGNPVLASYMYKLAAAVHFGQYARDG